MRDPRPDLTGGRWFTSSFSDNQSQCVEVVIGPDVVGVRDTKQRGTGPVLVFTKAEWAAFLAGVRAGEFDAF